MFEGTAVGAGTLKAGLSITEMYGELVTEFTVAESFT
jgi:hypothetical protein